MNIEPAISWITEREAIRERRAAGQPAPWTTDPILAAYRFCNVRREDDAVTRHIAQFWRDPYRDDPHLWFAMTVARLLNWPDTLDELGYPVPWDREHFRRVLASRQLRGDQVVGAAYVITNGGKSMSKADYLADVLHRMWKARDWMSPQRGTTLAAYAARLQDFDGIGSFIAGQIVADLKYIEPLYSAADWMSFAISGPGSKRGLNRVMGKPVDAAWTEPAWQAAFRRFEAAIRPELEHIGVANLHCQDLQNCLCELDKYLRCTLGEGRPKRRFCL